MPAKKKTTHDMILKKSFEILKKQGFESITVKNLAKQLNCSTQPIYLSFSGIDDLKKEMIPLAIKEFEKQMNGKNNIIKLYSIDYVLFAKKEPKLFCFLFMRENAFCEMKSHLLPMIEASIKELMKEYNISYEQADLLHDHMWMQAHGIASMVATRFCNWNIEKVKSMLKESEISFIKRK